MELTAIEQGYVHFDALSLTFNRTSPAKTQKQPCTVAYRWYFYGEVRHISALCKTCIKTQQCKWAQITKYTAYIANLVVSFVSSSQSFRWIPIVVDKGGISNLYRSYHHTYTVYRYRDMQALYGFCCLYSCAPNNFGLCFFPRQLLKTELGSFFTEYLQVRAFIFLF